MNHLEYVTCGTCSRLITIDVDAAGIIRNLSFLGGCSGNLKGITCGSKDTSCPDQLATALEQMGY